MSETPLLLNNSYVHLHCASVSAHISQTVLKLSFFGNTEYMYCSYAYTMNKHTGTECNNCWLHRRLNHFMCSSIFCSQLQAKPWQNWHSLGPLQQTTVIPTKVYSACWRWKCQRNSTCSLHFELFALYLWT